MQKGLATLEIIFAITIIGVLVKVAVPNAAQILDTAALDYETKRLYSELRFAQEMSRSSTVVRTGTGNLSIGSGGDYVFLDIKRDQNYYQVSRGTKSLRERHYPSYGVKIKLEDKNDTIIKIYFDTDGKADINGNNAGTITLTSRRGKNRYIIFDSVGRMRAALTKD